MNQQKLDQAIQDFKDATSDIEIAQACLDALSKFSRTPEAGKAELHLTNARYEARMRLVDAELRIRGSA